MKHDCRSDEWNVAGYRGLTQKLSTSVWYKRTTTARIIFLAMCAFSGWSLLSRNVAASLNNIAWGLLSALSAVISATVLISVPIFTLVLGWQGTSSCFLEGVSIAVFLFLDFWICHTSFDASVGGVLHHLFDPDGGWRGIINTHTDALFLTSSSYPVSPRPGRNMRLSFGPPWCAWNGEPTLSWMC